MATRAARTFSAPWRSGTTHGSSRGMQRQRGRRTSSIAVCSEFIRNSGYCLALHTHVDQHSMCTPEQQACSTRVHGCGCSCRGCQGRELDIGEAQVDCLGRPNLFRLNAVCTCMGGTRMGVHRCASARVCIGRTSWTARTKDFDRYLSLLLGRRARRAVSSAPPSKVTCNATPGLLRSQQTNCSVRRLTRPSAPGVPLDVDSCPLLITTCSIARSGSSCRGNVMR